MRCWPVCILLFALLGGCLESAGPDGPTRPSPSSTSSPAPQPTPAFPLHAHESARFDVLAGDRKIGWFELNLTLEGSRLVGALRQDLPFEDKTGRATYDAASGRLLELKIDRPPPSLERLNEPTFFFPLPEDGLLPFWVPPLPHPVSILPLGAAWLAFGGAAQQGWRSSWTPGAWSLDATAPCSHRCLSMDAMPLTGWSVHAEGTPDGVFPTLVRTTAEPGRLLVLERVRHWTDGEAVPVPPPAPPPHPALPMRECGPTPCEDGRLPASMREGYDALLAHPAWTAWKLAHPKSYIEQVSLSYANASLAGQEVPNASWLVVPGSEGNASDLFGLVSYASMHRPVFNHFRPAIHPWYEAYAGFSGKPERTVWPSWDDVVASWTAFAPPNGKDLIHLGLFAIGPAYSPNPDLVHVLSLHWVDADGTHWGASGYAEDGHLLHIWLSIQG